MSHTPGPWTLRIGDGENGANGVGYIETPHPHGHPWAREIAVVYGMEEFSSAAQLIAAAPDLLAALKGLRALIVGECGATLYECVDGERADAAIAKAEGR